MHMPNHVEPKWWNLPCIYITLDEHGASIHAALCAGALTDRQREVAREQRLGAARHGVITGTTADASQSAWNAMQCVPDDPPPPPKRMCHKRVGLRG
jgi:hypothetical protein